MEPISMIVGALVAGASTALKDTASQAVKDAYQGLKNLLIQHWKSKTEEDTKTKEIEAKVFIDNLESDPAGFKKPMEKKLNEIMPEPDTALIERAQQLEKILEESGHSVGKYAVKIGDNSQDVQIGDRNKQVNEFK